MKQLHHFFEDKTIKNVLDIGTGTGDFIKTLNDTFLENTQITGVDPGEQWLKEARTHFPQEHIHFLCMSGEQLDFADDTFDVISISNALHHLKNIEQSLGEMKRVLKPDGWLIINEICDDKLTKAQENQKMLHHFKSYVDRLHGISHHETYSPDKIQKIIQQNNIEVVHSFLHNKVKQANFDEKFLDEKFQQMKSLLEELQGRTEFDLMKDQLPVFKQQTDQHGFHMAPQFMLIGKAKPY